MSCTRSTVSGWWNDCKEAYNNDDPLVKYATYAAGALAATAVAGVSLYALSDVDWASLMSAARSLVPSASGSWFAADGPPPSAGLLPMSSETFVGLPKTTGLAAWDSPEKTLTEENTAFFGKLKKSALSFYATWMGGPNDSSASIISVNDSHLFDTSPSPMCLPTVGPS